MFLFISLCFQHQSARRTTGILGTDGAQARHKNGHSALNNKSLRPKGFRSVPAIDHTLSMKSLSVAGGHKNRLSQRA
jgi:hypothetical protein